MTMSEPSRRSLLLRVVLPCFLAQNLAFGVSQGSFGPLLQSNSEHFGVSQSTMVFCASMLNLSMGVVAPVVSNFMDRISIRHIMIGGSLASALGYYGLYASSSFPVALAMYCLLGVGCAILGVLAPLALVNRWLPASRGRVLGWVNAPIILLLVPLLIGRFMPAVGRDGIFLISFGVLLATIPLFMTVLEDAGHERGPAVPGSGPPKGRDEVREILRDGGFWMIAIAIGVMAGMSSAFIVHVVSVGIERGMSFQAAASLVSVFAASGVLGSVVLGWLCDRIGALLTVALSAFCQALLCIALVYAQAPHTFLLTSMMGVFSVPILTLMGSVISQTIAPRLVNRAIGVIYFIKLPFIFAFAPLFGFVSHVGERFAVSFYMMSAFLALAAGGLLLLYKERRQGRPAT